MGQKRRAGSVSHGKHAEGIGRLGQNRRGPSSYAFRSEPHHESSGFRRLFEISEYEEIDSSSRKKTGVKNLAIFSPR